MLKLTAKKLYAKIRNLKVDAEEFTLREYELNKTISLFQDISVNHIEICLLISGTAGIYNMITVLQRLRKNIEEEISDIEEELKKGGFIIDGEMLRPEDLLR